MFRYEIPCNDLDRALDTIDRYASSNRRPWSAGIHFKKRNGLHIRGFMLAENEWDIGGRGGFPLTVEFQGRFIRKEDGRVVLDVLMFPALWQVAVFPLGLWQALYLMRFDGICIWGGAALLSMKFYSKQIDKAVAELKRITGAFWCDEP